MIDIENLVFDKFYDQMSILHPEANITAGYDEHTAKYPCVVVQQTNSQPYRDSATDECSENHSRVTFEIEVYSDQANTGRSQCSTLLNDADDIMQSMKFRRIHLNRPLNVNRTLWRRYARYEVIVGKPIEIDGNTVYHMYRR